MTFITRASKSLDAKPKEVPGRLAPTTSPASVPSAVPLHHPVYFGKGTKNRGYHPRCRTVLSRLASRVHTQTHKGSAISCALPRFFSFSCQIRKSSPSLQPHSPPVFLKSVLSVLLTEGDNQFPPNFKHQPEVTGEKELRQSPSQQILQTLQN